MQIKRRTARAVCGAFAVVALSALVLVSGASAHTGEYAKFNYCPSTNPEVKKCLFDLTESGQIVLGKKTVPIVNPVTLQAGVSEANEETSISHLVAATNGVTLSKTPQPVPGGLSGLVNCKEISLSFLRASCESIFENGLTGVNATLELAKPANEALLNEFFLASEENGTALKLPVKVHLENPLLGSTCYIGSSSTPIIWNLTTGTTAPPAPNKPLKGSAGEALFLEEGRILELKGSQLVDNAWAAPGASGCGGFLVEYILDPIINASVGVPSAAGRNTAILKGNSYLVSAAAVNKH
jgi:hypothetical protein